jgi:hypothetical protein
MKRVSIVFCVLAISLIPVTASAQWISLGLRGSGGIPTGTFADVQSSSSSAVVTGAKYGFGYGLEAGAGIGPIGAYAGFDHIKFDCQVTSCFDEGSYTLQGASIGLKLSSHGFSILRPFVKGGVTFNSLRGSYGSSSNSLSSDRAPGYEIAAGADVSLMGLIGLAPQIRYVGQNLNVKVPGVSSPNPDGQGVNYFTFDVGLTFHTPYTLFGARRAR